MEKKYQIIYIWSFIIVSGIILLLLYTPLGGDLHYAAYNEQGRYNVAPGVNYSSQVGGFSGGTSSGGSYNYSPSVSAYTSPNYKAISSANYSTATNFGSSASYSGGGLALPNRTVSGGGGAGSSGMGMMAVGGGRKSTNEVSNAFSGGGSMGGSLFNTTTVADGGVMQRGTEDEDDPLDPGGDPTNPPLPLGDDIKILLLFGAVFAFYKWLTIPKK